MLFLFLLSLLIRCAGAARVRSSPTHLSPLPFPPLAPRQSLLDRRSTLTGRPPLWRASNMGQRAIQCRGQARALPHWRHVQARPPQPVDVVLSSIRHRRLRSLHRRLHVSDPQHCWRLRIVANGDNRDRLFSIGNLTALFKSVWPNCWSKYTVCDQNWIAAVSHKPLFGMILIKSRRSRICRLSVSLQLSSTSAPHGLVQDALIMTSKPFRPF